MDNVNYNGLFSEIIKGYSKVNHTMLGVLYLKHFSHSETGEIEDKYREYLEEAKNNRIPTYKEQEEYIIKTGLWTEKDELNVLMEQQFLDNMRLTYSKEYLNSRRIQTKKTIEEGELRLNALKLRKESYMSATAESYANKKTIGYKISNSFFKDKSCKEIIDTVSDENIYNECLSLFYKNQDILNHESIKRLSISSFFMNLFSLTEDNIFHFYGKPVVELTAHQVDLFMYGRYFKHVLSEHGSTIPKNVQMNPDELINWIDLRKNAKDARLIDDEKGGSMTIVGAKKEDYEMLGLSITTNTAASKKLREKGMITKDELFAMEN